MYHLISHVVFQKNVPIYGPVHVLETFLRQHKKKVAVVLLPLTLDGSFLINKGDEKIETAPRIKNLLVKYLYDSYYCFSYIFYSQLKKKDVIIAADPLTCWSFAICKVFFKYKLIYYTVDYSQNRFKNKLLNFLYYALDRTCLFVCNQNWCVSERIVAVRLKQGYRDKVKFVPNTPVLPEKPQKSKPDSKYNLIYVGRMEKNMHVPLILEAAERLHALVPETKLTMIGGGPLEKSVVTTIKKNKLQSFIDYLGPQDNTVVIRTIKKAGIGLALYSGGDNWNIFGDSMKIREYQYFGLPVVSTNIPSNSIEIENEKAGILLSEPIRAQEVVQAIMAIQGSYTKYSQAAYKVTISRKKSLILQKLLHFRKES